VYDCDDQSCLHVVLLFRFVGSYGASPVLTVKMMVQVNHVEISCSACLIFLCGFGLLREFDAI